MLDMISHIGRCIKAPLFLWKVSTVCHRSFHFPRGQSVYVTAIQLAGMETLSSVACFHVKSLNQLPKGRFFSVRGSAAHGANNMKVMSSIPRNYMSRYKVYVTVFFSQKRNGKEGLIQLFNALIQSWD